MRGRDICVTSATPNNKDSERFRPTILLLGKNGQIGSELCPLLAGWADLHVADKRTLDLLEPRRIREFVRSLKPHVIVNAAAYTAVDKAESEPEVAALVNTSAPGILAEEAASLDALLVHYSTDYVFDGTKPEPYVESDSINPLSVYGKTKAAGEELIRASGCKHLIFRTSWVYGPRGSNFLLTILRLAHEREELRIVDDQIGAPTSSEAIAQATFQVIKKCVLEHRSVTLARSGTYHMTASGHVSWFGFASEIIRQCADQSLRLRKVIPIPTSEYPTPARRPFNSRLNCLKLADTFGVSLPGWREGLAAVVESLGHPTL